MALNNFIPALWANELKRELRKNLVYAQAGVVNFDYEGQISAYGDRVHVHTFADLTIGDYTKNTDHAVAETMTDSRVSLVIDQAKFFNFQIDDIDKAQQNPKVMAGAMSRAAYNLADVADQHVAAQYADVVAGNFVGTEAAPKSISAAGDYHELLVELAVELDEANVPRTDRFVVIPPWFHGGLQKDVNFIGSGDLAAQDVRLNGQVGRAAGLNVLVSNNVPDTTDTTTGGFKIVAGFSGACTHAEQIADMEAYRPERRFADALKGLHLYGSKLILTDGWALATVQRP